MEIDPQEKKKPSIFTKKVRYFVVPIIREICLFFIS